MTHAEKEALIRSTAFDLIIRIYNSETLSVEAKAVAEACTKRYVSQHTQELDRGKL